MGKEVQDFKQRSDLELVFNQEARDTTHEALKMVRNDGSRIRNRKRGRFKKQDGYKISSTVYCFYVGSKKEEKVEDNS